MIWETGATASPGEAIRTELEATSRAESGPGMR